MLEGVDDQVLLARPAAVQRRLAGVGAGGDPLHRQADVADRLELVEHGIEDGALEGLAAAPGPAVRRRRTGQSRRGVRRSGHGADLPKRILRILVNACVPNTAGRTVARIVNALVL